MTKIFFTTYTYAFHLANILSTKCLELENFPWYLLYIFANRVAIIAEISTFLFMSFAKVILNWRIDFYVRLNSNLTVNLATLAVLVLNLIDLIIRFDMHILDDCEDILPFKVYQIEFRRKFCVPEMNNTTVNLTVCQMFSQAEDVYQIGCKQCPPNPTIRILLGSVLLLETIKFSMGFYRIMKKYCKKIKYFRKNKTSIIQISLSQRKTKDFGPDTDDQVAKEKDISPENKVENQNGKEENEINEANGDQNDDKNGIANDGDTLHTTLNKRNTTATEDGNEDRKLNSEESNKLR